jgi:hypothetical protein
MAVVFAHDFGYVHTGYPWMYGADIFFPPGWFLLLSSLIGFWRVKHWEASIRATQARGPPTAEEIERDIETRRTLENVFHLSGLADHETSQDEIPTPAQLEEARLRRDLHSAGLL